jgi:hypothetical protein
MILKNKISSAFYYAVIAYGLGIILLEYLPYLILSGKDFRFAASKICFYYLQIVFYALASCLVKVIFTNNLNKKDILFYSMLSTIFTYYKATFIADDFFKEYGLYLNIFKSSSANSNDLFFQYALIMIVAVIFTYAIGHLLIFKKTILRIFFLLISFAYFTFFYFGHAFIVKEAYFDYVEQNNIRLQYMLNNSDNYLLLCEKLEYQCLITDGKTIPEIKIEIKNLGHQGRYMEHDTLEEKNARKDGVRVISAVIEKFVESNENERIYSSNEIEGNNLRGMNAAAKRLPGNKALVVLDFNSLTYGLDLYLFYISLLTTFFLILWTTIIYVVYKIHTKNPLIKKIGMIDGDNPSHV